MSMLSNIFVLLSIVCSTSKTDILVFWYTIFEKCATQYERVDSWKKILKHRNSNLLNASFSQLFLSNLKLNFCDDFLKAPYSVAYLYSNFKINFPKIDFEKYILTKLINFWPILIEFSKFLTHWLIFFSIFPKSNKSMPKNHLWNQ